MGRLRANFGWLAHSMQNAHMRVQKVQKVQRVQRVVVAASPQIIAAGAAGWVEGLLASPCGR